MVLIWWNSSKNSLSPVPPFPDLFFPRAYNKMLSVAHARTHISQCNIPCKYLRKATDTPVLWGAVVSEREGVKLL